MKKDDGKEDSQRCKDACPCCDRKTSPLPLIRDISILDVFSCTLWKGSIWGKGPLDCLCGREDTLVRALIPLSLRGVEQWRYPATSMHTGHEELFYNPSAFADCVITRGTTTVYSDGHNMINSIGLPAFIRVLDSAAHYAVKFLWGVPATYPHFPGVEGGPIFSSGELKSLLARYDDCVSLSEVDSYDGYWMAKIRLLKPCLWPLQLESVQRAYPGGILRSPEHACCRWD